MERERRDGGRQRETGEKRRLRVQREKREREREAGFLFPLDDHNLPERILKHIMPAFLWQIQHSTDAQYRCKERLLSRWRQQCCRQLLLEGATGPFLPTADRGSAIRKEAFQTRSKSHLTLTFQRAFQSIQQQYTKTRSSKPSQKKEHTAFWVPRGSQGERFGRKWSSYFSGLGFLSWNFTYSRTVQICHNVWETHCELLNLVN